MLAVTFFGLWLEFWIYSRVCEVGWGALRNKGFLMTERKKDRHLRRGCRRRSGGMFKFPEVMGWMRRGKYQGNRG